MDRPLFIKMLTDTSRMTGNFMDDYTAGLFYDRFHDVEYDDLDRLMLKFLGSRQKITYDVLESGLKKKHVEKIEELKPIVYDCTEDCKLCQRDVVCVPMFKRISPLINLILQGERNCEEVMEELHKEYPFVGFDKRYGDATGVVKNEVGEYLTIYTYPEMHKVPEHSDV